MHLGDPIPLPFSASDTLWVRETWQHAPQQYCSCPQPSEPSPCDAWCEGIGCISNRGEIMYRVDSDKRFPWRSPVTMPRWASRLTLTVRDVQVRRVQSISYGEVGDAGIMSAFWYAFRQHWERSGLDWDANPWCAFGWVDAKLGNVEDQPND